MIKCILYVVAGATGALGMPGCYCSYDAIVPHGVVDTSHHPATRVRPIRRRYIHRVTYHNNHHNHHIRRHRHYRRPRTVNRRNVYNRTIINRHYYNSNGKKRRKGKKNRRR